MKKLALSALGGALFAVIIVACGGGSKDKVITTIDSGTVQSTCDPVAQTGCETGQKCAWIVDQAGGSSGSDLAHIGCTANGTAGLGSACTGGPGVMGADTCTAGLACDDAACVNICAPGGTTCPSGKGCQIFADYFQVGSAQPVAGVCKPVCDPLTQEEGLSVAIGSADNKGSACPTMEGCYGAPFKDGNFTCVPSGGSANTDGTQPGSANGGPFVNSCAPGNVLLFDFTVAGATVSYCMGYCEPSDTYAGSGWSGGVMTGTPGITANKDGVAPYNCGRSAVGGDSNDSCVFAWSLGAPDDDFVPGTDPITALEPFSDHTGLCWKYPVYNKYDPTDPQNGTNPVQPWPRCDQVAILDDSTIDITMCTATTCGGSNAPRLFSAIGLGCVSYETALADLPASLSGKRKMASPLSSLRFAAPSHHPLTANAQ